MFEQVERSFPPSHLTPQTLTHYQNPKSAPSLTCSHSLGWVTLVTHSKGVSCYPRYLGITRRSCLEAHMVLDMEYREQELPEHGPGGPFFFFSARFVLPAVPASITTGLGLHQRRLLLHEVIGPRYHGMCHI
jgi:hypothetical protein